MIVNMINQELYGNIGINNILQKKTKKLKVDDNQFYTVQ